MQTMMKNNNQFELVEFENIKTLRVKKKYNPVIKIPFEAPHDFIFTERIAAIVHVFYVELFVEILQHIQHIPTQVDLFISTNTKGKEI